MKDEQVRRDFLDALEREKERQSVIDTSNFKRLYKVVARQMAMQQDSEQSKITGKIILEDLRKSMEV